MDSYMITSFQRLGLFLSVLFALTTAVRAQSQPPIALEDVGYFEIHDENGDLGMTIEVEQTGNGEFELQAFDADGTPFANPSTATYMAEGLYLVQNGDSGNETWWLWEGDHYTKIGGTRFHREFHPVM
jgi:hypothetical protein